MQIRRVLRYIWAGPTTALGLAFVPVAIVSWGRMQVVEGVIEIYGGGVTWFLKNCTLLKHGASAMTLGHVVLGCDQETLQKTRRHERVHVRQCERWGPLFIPAYLIASFVAMLRGQNAYLDNRFEREAYNSV